MAYHTGQYTLATKACSEIWSHFTLPSVTDSEACEEPAHEEANEGLAQTKLDNHINGDYIPDVVSEYTFRDLHVLFVLYLSLKVVSKDIAAVFSFTAAAFSLLNLHADRHPHPRESTIL